MNRSPTRWVFSGTGLKLVTRPATNRYLYHSATAATGQVRKTRYELAPSSSNNDTTPTLSLDRFNVHRPPLHNGCSMAPCHKIGIITSWLTHRYLF
ncbi:hypothetical protein TNCV_749471 [Trichonephila clavipes]|nr:hypothetical protein TNCV_749471 [Trichonephila clavipes]